MDSVVASCKDKLAYFRIKELKDVLTELGLSKQGKKQDLVDRILAILSDERVSRMSAKKGVVGREDVAKLVDDTYRKMQASGATDLATKGQNVLDINNVKIKMEDYFQSDKKIRCPCGDSLETESMIKCVDPRCEVSQHVGCVLVPEKFVDDDLFYCEICRLSRADPFWVSVAHPLYPVKLATTNIPSDDSNPVQSVEKTFHLTRADKDLLAKQDHDLQACCMLLNDKVPFRMQWPQYTELQVNGEAVCAINRPGSQLLGANGRDDGPIITDCTRDGTNKISLTGRDSRIFCLGVRIVRRRTVQQILSLIPKESDGERFEDALARVCRCVGGGNATDNADSDSDLEVVADSFTVNLRCPMSGSRIKVAGRFIPCAHMGCFDLEVFVELNQRSRKWQCPICLKNYSLEYLIIDPYFNRITSKMQYCGEDVTELEVKPDGSWRLKTKSEAERRDVGEDAQWHCPYGTLCAPNDGKPNSYVELATQIGIRKNHNGIGEFSRPGDMNTSSYGNRFQEKFENHNQNVIPMSSSATVSGRDGEDPSVNQDGGGNFDFTNNGIEHDSLSLNVDSRNGFAERNVSAPLGDAEVIILSDSDDEHDVLMSSGNAYKNNQTDEGEAAFSVLPGMGDPYSEDPTMGTGNLLLNPNDEEFISIWPLPSVTQGPPVFQLFSPDISDPLVGLHHGSANCPSTSYNGYPLPPETVMGPIDLVPDPSLGRSETDLNDGLVDNPLAFGGEDPSLQIFLPTRPSDASAESDVRGQVDVSNGIRTDDWISLRLGGGVTSSHRESLHANGLNSRGQMPSREGAMDSLADTASLLGMNDGKSEKASQQRSDSPFSFPRQKRSKTSWGRPVKVKLISCLEGEED